MLENTVRKLDLGITPDQLAGQVEISGVGQTNIVSIKATSGDPQTAADIANTLAEEFVAWSRDYKRESIQCCRFPRSRRGLKQSEDRDSGARQAHQRRGQER